MTLGEKIRNYRISQGMTQSDLAIVVEKDISTISKIETNSANPSLQTLLQIAQALKVTVQDLITEYADNN